MITGLKKCKVCGDKFYAKFFCRKHYERNLRKINPEFRKRQLENRRKYWKTHKKELTKKKKIWLKTASGKLHLRNKILKKYNINSEIYENLLNRQKYKCAICGRKHTDNKKLNVDHSHKTGKIRGLLCVRCNCSLGYFGDELKMFNKIVKYLKKDDRVV